MTTLLAATAIIMEGGSDCHFMRQYLGHLGFGSLLFGGGLKDAGRAGKIIVRETGKNGGIPPLIGGNAPSPDVVNICETSNNILIVVDANSDCEKRRDELRATVRKIEKEPKTDAKIFLLPDDESVGELENLLEEISVGKEIYECLEQYEKCLRTKNRHLATNST